LNITWGKLSPQLALQITRQLNETLESMAANLNASIPRASPTFVLKGQGALASISKLRITNLSWGSSAPFVELVSLDEAPTDESSSPSTPEDFLSLLLGQQGLLIKTHLSYAGNASLTVEVELSIDVPCPGFIRFPLAFCVSDLKFDGILVAVIRKKGDSSAPWTVSMYLQQQEQRRSPLRHMSITAVFGGPALPDGHCVDTTEVANFVRSEIQALIEATVVEPNALTLAIPHELISLPVLFEGR